MGEAAGVLCFHPPWPCPCQGRSTQLPVSLVWFQGSAPPTQSHITGPVCSCLSWGLSSGSALTAEQWLPEQQELCLQPLWFHFLGTWERPGMPGRRLLCCRPFYGEPSSLSAFEENSDTELSRQKLDRRSFAEHGNNPGS